MENNIQKRFLDYIGKVDSNNIILKNKLRGSYNREIFFIQKKYILNLYAICDFCI